MEYAAYLPDIDPSDLAFDGSSMSYSGPMVKLTSGGPPSGEDAGTGTISLICP